MLLTALTCALPVWCFGAANWSSRGPVTTVEQNTLRGGTFPLVNAVHNRTVGDVEDILVQSRLQSKIPPIVVTSTYRADGDVEGVLVRSP